ncbi:hypothetical protein QWA68_016719 [Fusarium oxysporum]|nr:hypothetical protein QWA68_016719 [Fusarium oxysporum]
MTPHPPGHLKRSKWKFFRPDLGFNTYFLGDAYHDGKRKAVIECLEKEGKYWGEQDGEYLAYVRSLVGAWPELQLLVDFMNVGTIPTRWCHFPGEQQPKKGRPRYVYGTTVDEIREEQHRRAKAINVALLEYKTTGTPSLHRYNSEHVGPEAAVRGLQDAVARVRENLSADIKLSLFVVEDLTRDVIETLGAGLAIDPRFFRAHVVDYVWNNIRDPWREYPLLDIVARQRDWFQLRLVRTRYFPNEEDLHAGQDEVERFNIMRRMDADGNQIFWDKDAETPSHDQTASKASKNDSNGNPPPRKPEPSPEKPVDAKVGHIRSRATLWLRHDDENGTAVGVLLLEPTTRHGCPLWRGYANWEELPRYGEQTDVPLGPPSVRSDIDKALKTWFEDFLFWAQKETLFPILRTESAPHSLCIIVPIQALLHLVSTEWLTFADYINARLNQIDWEISRPAFLPVTQDRESIMDKLSVWRRWLPICRDMLSGTLRQVAGFEWQQRRRGLEQLKRPQRGPVQCADTYGRVVDESDASRFSRDVKNGPIFGPYKRDYELVLERLVDYEARIDRLSTVVNSAVSLEDARNTAKSSESMGNLTLLASLFVPPSLIASILGMNTESLTENALKWWAVASVVAVLLLFGLYQTMTNEHLWRFWWKLRMRTADRFAAMARWVVQIGEGGKDADAVQVIQDPKNGAPQVNGDGNV